MKKSVVTSIIGCLKLRPDYNSRMTDEILCGMEVKILKVLRNNWCKIRTHYNYEGYINGKDLLISGSLADFWHERKKLIVNAKCADLMSSASFKSTILKSLTKGCIVAELSCDKDGFAKVCLPDGTSGFVRESFLSEKRSRANILSENEFRISVANTAMDYLGTQYRWGGKTPFGIDCSGLASMAYMLNGAIIYRDAKIKKGFPVKEISLKKIKKADLIFFPGHIAIYIEDGRFIHSSMCNNGVNINSLNENHDCYREDLLKSISAVGSIF